MARAKIRQKTRNQSISPTAMWVLGDRRLYEEPEQLNKWELVADPALEYPTTNFLGCKKLWDSAKEEILADWVNEFPGTRPSWWWLFDAPRMSAEDLQCKDWTDCYFAPHLCEPRKRLGGVGKPIYDTLNYVPHFECGLPSTLVETDPDNPPTFESQAAYLKRHGLLQPGEERRLKAKDFEPEAVLLPEEAVIQ